ncbi:MAG: PEP-CTERM sorting domain-containing protein [Rubrivivax sp.]|nr:PEP-CTERM sorting domain-containing protein [Rubrivivax sp.]MDP3083818.1 PEP-CTERM sorting domain-containing protein [Rubrivivax sp.]
MNNQSAFIVSAVLLAAGMTLSAGASAQSTWNVYNGSSGGSGCSQNATNTGSFNNSYACTGVGTAGTSMTASAWSSNSDRGATAGIQGTVNTTSTNTSTFYGAEYALSGSGFASALLSDQGSSGLGGTSRLEAQTARAGGDTTPLSPGSPNHAFDSIAPGAFDMLLLDFGSTSVILDKIGIGWKQTQADITVMRWTGATAPTKTVGASTMTGDGHQNLTSVLYNPANPGTAGWQLVGSYQDLGTDSAAPFGDAARSLNTTLSSSWWLVSAFNTTLTGGSSACTAANGSAATCTAGNDSFKFNYIATKNPSPPGLSVSEPSSLALATLALVGGVWSRRRRTTALAV